LGKCSLFYPFKICWIPFGPFQFSKALLALAWARRAFENYLQKEKEKEKRALLAWATN
jgi:hypothetical protein